jgi:hypothetical protein
MKQQDAVEATPAIAPWERALVRLVLALGRSPWGVSGNGRARGVLHIFRLEEWLAERGHRILPLSGGLLRYEVGPLPRGSLPLPGGEVVKQGDPVVILHFVNHAVGLLPMKADNRGQVAWQLYRGTEEAFTDLARLAEAHLLPAGVRVVWAETLVYTTLKRMGFSTRPSPRTIRTPFARLYFLGLVGIYSLGGVEQLKTMRLDHIKLGEAWISLDELQRRFGAEGVRARRTGPGRRGPAHRPDTPRR